jgi:hypothetical protein
MKKLDPKRYVKAARAIASGRELFSCNAIGRKDGGTPEQLRHRKAYREAFGYSDETSPRGDPFLNDMLQAGYDVWVESGFFNTLTNLRVLSLLMMAAYVEVCDD